MACFHIVSSRRIRTEVLFHFSIQAHGFQDMDCCGNCYFLILRGEAIGKHIDCLMNQGLEPELRNHHSPSLRMSFGAPKNGFLCHFVMVSRLTPTISATSRSVLPKIRRSIALSCSGVSLGASGSPPASIRRSYLFALGLMSFNLLRLLSICILVLLILSASFKLPWDLSFLSHAAQS